MGRAGGGRSSTQPSATTTHLAAIIFEFATFRILEFCRGIRQITMMMHFSSLVGFSSTRAN